MPEGFSGNWLKRRSNRSNRKERNRTYQSPLGSASRRPAADQWNLIKKDVYVAPPRHQIPGWLIPLASFLLIVLFVFVVAPALTNRISGMVNPTSPSGQAIVDQLYGDETAVVRVPVADLLNKPDLKGERVAQALYNEPVAKTDVPAAAGFTAVRLSDGSEGFMFADQLTDLRESIEPAAHQYKLVISAPTRRIMTHASRGTLVAEVMMGTVLFSDYRGDGVYRVHLPAGGWGWISDEGTIALGIHDMIKPAKDLARYFASSAMAFHRVTRLENGLSVRGASSTGMAYIAARINGVTLPRTLTGQSAAGKPVTLRTDPSTALLDLSVLKTGDLVFFASESDGKKPGEMGIVLTDGQLLMSRRGWTSIRMVNLSQFPELHRQIISVRRIITEP